MLRKASGSFVLMRAGDEPGDPEVEEPYSCQAVYHWLQDLPEQIERNVIMGGRYAELEKSSAGACGQEVRREHY
jgi:DNA gyrase inhibitor GyrI